MEARAKPANDKKTKESYTAMTVAQGFYLSPKYNHFQNDTSRNLIHYLVAYAKHQYAFASKWAIVFFDAVPAFAGKKVYSLFKAINYPGQIASRKAYISQSVDEAIKDGVEQVIVFGGGFDVLSLVKHKQNPRVTFFELDRGPHRELKLQALDALAKQKFPTSEIKKLAKGLDHFAKYGRNMHFINADFSENRWRTQLLNHGFDPKKKTICIAEGLTMYLTQGELCEMLKTLHHELLAPNSTMILSFLEDAKHTLSENVTRQLLKRTEEDYKMRLSQNQVPQFLSDNGFHIIGSLTYADMQKSLGLKESEMSWVANMRENYFKVQPRPPELVHVRGVKP